MLEMPADAEMRMSQGRAADCHVATIIRWRGISGGLKRNHQDYGRQLSDFYFIFLNLNLPTRGAEFEIEV